MGGFLRRGLSGAVAVALAGVLAGCAGDAGAPLADAAGDPTPESSDRQGLPPGVVPPSGEPEPGDARLGPDGYYDYTADDFVLQNPCDGLPFELAQQQGYRLGDNASPRDDESFSTVCRMAHGEPGSPLVLAAHSFGQPDFETMGYEVTIQESSGRSWYTVALPGLISDICFAGVDTSKGAVGAGIGIGGFSPHTTERAACDAASELFNRIYGGNSEYSGPAI